MRDDLWILRALGIDPAKLDPAPDGPLRYSGARDQGHGGSGWSCRLRGLLEGRAWMAAGRAG
ncbi:hypothetical protein ABZ876_12980 [Streptomyces sp. NPDC046931]|uniref:hypothetical protein n=1 Tax=Streptomyces sp. NPDC046931 TaxID=3154806 RepID=UPI00340231FB